MSTTAELPLSVSIISFNEAANIERTLDSVQPIASEIIVVDSHSTDNTRELAEQKGAKVFDEEWKGHIRQKNSALEKCTQPWILSLDCDEVLSVELREEIVRAAREGDRPGYQINRRTFYLGKLLSYAWQPDWNLRLVRRDAAPEWVGYDPHDRLQIEGPSGRLNGDLIHYSYADLKDHMQRLVAYAEIAANSYHRNGKLFRWDHLLMNPMAAFIKKYILKRAFLDGSQGFIVSMSSFIYVFLKYLFLWEIDRGLKRKEKVER
ncbi:MAG: glycosyltransferase family 2 protein [Thermodesulfobacteriota bacterium]